MNILHNQYDTIETFIYNQGLKISSLDFDHKASKMRVILNNNHAFVVSINSYKRLKNALPNSLQHFIIIANGTGIHWPELDEDLSLKGFLSQYLQQKIKTEEELVIY